MAFRIISKGQDAIPSKATKPVKRVAYLDWIRELPCVVTKQHGVQAAHLSTARRDVGHTGRGKAQKASDEWCLPLSPDQHRLQHAGNEREYWRLRGIDPYLACLVLFRLYTVHDRADATEHAERIINSGIARI